jgi:DnaJ like chaperone protein
LEKLVHSVFLRLPNLSMPDVLTVLADIAKCDGEIHPSEIHVIRQAALAMGLGDEDWSELAPELGLGGDVRQPMRPSYSGMSEGEARTVLGVDGGASRAQIQAAYRKLVSDYHPDRVANLPKEFQDVAHEKMTKINAAYETIGKWKQ